MANEILKEIKTKIALKVLTYAEWDAIKDTYKPLRGEVCFCEIPDGNTSATNAPTVLFKVGDGQKTFGELKWASALAADVYSWAKKSEDEFKEWVKKVVTVDDIDLSNYYTKEEVVNLLAGIDEQIDALYTNDELDSKFEEVQNHVDRTAVQVEKAANDYAAAAAVKAETNAKTYADTKVTELADGAVKANTDAIAAEVTAREEAVAVVERAVKTETGRAIAAEEANAKAIADEALRAKDAEGKNAGAIADEAATRKAADEALAADIAVAERAIKTETGRAQAAEEALQAQITANTNAITTITEGIDPDKIDGLTDLVKWADEHAPEVASIKADIEEVAENLNAYESKLGFVTTGDKTVAEVIDETLAKKAEIAAVMVDNAANAEKLGGELPGYYATAQSVTDITKDNGTIDSKISAYDEGKNFGDIITHNVDEFATKDQGTKADTALQNVEVGTGLKVSEKVDNKQTIEIDTDVVFVLDCNW